MANDTVALIAALGGELVTYTPFGGVATVIRVLVDRDRAAHQAEQTNGHTYGLNTRELLIAHDALDGVTTIQVHKDTVTFKNNLSDATETTFTVQTILKEDVGVAGGGGAFRLLVQS